MHRAWLQFSPGSKVGGNPIPNIRPRRHGRDGKRVKDWDSRELAEKYPHGRALFTQRVTPPPIMSSATAGGVGGFHLKAVT